MWQGIQAITNYKSPPPACDSDASLPDVLNNFYDRFVAQNSLTARKTTPPPIEQGCVLSPLLFTLLTHNCSAKYSSNHIIKFADGTTVVGLISENDESAYREEVQQLTDWCRANNLSLNVDKTKEMVVDFQRVRGDHPPLNITGSAVEIVRSTKFLGVHITQNLTCSTGGLWRAS
ncbi:hypothetical protein AOLI_G00053620 [Acnodon oligacanthus]